MHEYKHKMNNYKMHKYKYKKHKYRWMPKWYSYITFINTKFKDKIDKCLQNWIYWVTNQKQNKLLASKKNAKEWYKEPDCKSMKMYNYLGLFSYKQEQLT